MTSSLVGSEMCIRDRVEICRSEETLLPGFISSSNLVATPAYEAVVSTAVSYTHLTLPTICSV
eukprot:4411859-Prorocentrum_lima.AAC.1